jgi:hypothetical protein
MPWPCSSSPAHLMLALGQDGVERKERDEHVVRREERRRGVQALDALDKRRQWRVSVNVLVAVLDDQPVEQAGDAGRGAGSAADEWIASHGIPRAVYVGERRAAQEAGDHAAEATEVLAVCRRAGSRQQLLVCARSRGRIRGRWASCVGADRAQVARGRAGDAPACGGAQLAGQADGEGVSGVDDVALVEDDALEVAVEERREPTLLGGDVAAAAGRAGERRVERESAGALGGVDCGLRQRRLQSGYERELHARRRWMSWKRPRLMRTTS